MIWTKTPVLRFLPALALSWTLSAQTSEPIYRAGRIEVLRNGRIQACGVETGNQWRILQDMPPILTSKEGRVFWSWDGQQIYRAQYTADGKVFLRTFGLQRHMDGRQSWTARSPQRLPDFTYPIVILHDWALCLRQPENPKKLPPEPQLILLVNLFTMESRELDRIKVPTSGEDVRGVLADGDMYLVYASGKVAILRSTSGFLETVEDDFWPSVEGLPAVPTRDKDLQIRATGIGMSLDGRLLVPFYGELPCDRKWLEDTFPTLPPARQQELIRQGYWPLPSDPLPYRVPYDMFIAFDLKGHKQSFIPFEKCKEVFKLYDGPHGDHAWRFDTAVPYFEHFWLDPTGLIKLIPDAPEPAPVPKR